MFRIFPIQFLRYEVDFDFDTANECSQHHDFLRPDWFATFLQNGASSTAEDSGGNCAAMMALGMGNWTGAKEILIQMGNADVVNRDGYAV